MLLVAVELIRRVVVAHERPREDAALANHAADAAHGERAAAEAEEKDLVARLVVGNEKTISVVDVVLDAAAEGAAAHSVDHVAGPYALVVVDHLQRAAGVALRDAVTELHDVGRAGHAVALLVGGVPRPVAAQHQPLHLIGTSSFTSEMCVADAMRLGAMYGLSTLVISSRSRWSGAACQRLP